MVKPNSRPSVTNSSVREKLAKAATSPGTAKGTEGSMSAFDDRLKEVEEKYSLQNHFRLLELLQL